MLQQFGKGVGRQNDQKLEKKRKLKLCDISKS